MEKKELEDRRRHLEISLANETQMSTDAKHRILMKLLDFIEEELVTGAD